MLRPVLDGVDRGAGGVLEGVVGPEVGDPFEEVNNDSLDSPVVPASPLDAAVEIDADDPRPRDEFEYSLRCSRKRESRLLAVLDLEIESRVELTCVSEGESGVSDGVLVALPP
jgi:hypothetical protein